MTDYIAQYKRKLRRKLKCSGKAKRELMAAFASSVAVFKEEHTTFTFEDLEGSFGPPEEMASMLLGQVSPAEQARYRKWTMIKRGLAGLLAAAFVGFTIYTYFFKSIPVEVIEEDIPVETGWEETYFADNENP